MGTICSKKATQLTWRNLALVAGVCLVICLSAQHAQSSRRRLAPKKEESSRRQISLVASAWYCGLFGCGHGKIALAGRDAIDAEAYKQFDKLMSGPKSDKGRRKPNSTQYPPDKLSKKGG